MVDSGSGDGGGLPLMGVAGSPRDSISNKSPKDGVFNQKKTFQDLKDIKITSFHYHFQKNLHNLWSHFD